MTNENINTDVTSGSLFQQWGIAYAKENGYDVPDDASVELRAETEGSGCCEMCWSEDAVAILTVHGREFRLSTSTWGFVGY